MSESRFEQDTEGLGQLQRQVSDVLGLAIAAGAPMPLLEKLGAASGLLQALNEVPKHTLIPEVVTRAHKALRAWHDWKGSGPRKVAA